MTLELFFRACITMLFQSHVTSDKTNRSGDKMSYDNQLFYLPRIYCKDGFNISLQIHNGNYCSTENGYREFGYSYKSIEWGFPSMFDELLLESAENSDNICNTVGSIDIETIQKVILKHGDIDWEITLSIDNCRKLIKD